MFSFLFISLTWRQWLAKVMRGVPSNAKRQVALVQAGVPPLTPKKLAKRPKPSSLWEESSPEDSPPCGGTPDSPEEIECLKIRAPDYHINREEVDYNKEDPRNIITLRDRSFYKHGKERGMNEILDILSWRLVSLRSLQEDISSGQTSVGAYWLHEEQEGHVL
jgi:hypothetical protein